MAAAFLGPDVEGGLFLLAELYQRRWTATSTDEMLAVAREIRLHEPRFGLTPIDRRRLQWEVPRDDQEPAAPRRRQPAATFAGKDPRDLLKVI